MKKIFLLILFLISFQQNLVFSQNIENPTYTNQKFHVDISNMSIENALIYIANKSKLKLIYSKDYLPSKKITIKNEFNSVKEAFEKVLEGTSNSIIYFNNDKIIVTDIKKKISNGTIRGIVSDSTNGEILAFGNILIKEINRGTSTDENGIFIFTGLAVPATYQLVVSYVGYQTKKLFVDIDPEAITKVNIELNPNSFELQTIEKVAEISPTIKETNISLHKISIKDLENLPQGVETDVFRSLQYLNGVKSSGDISGNFYVRGSPSNQNLVLLNDIPIYHPFHALGMFSAIDPEMIHNIEFYKSAFSSEYSGRLSSVLRLITKDGNKNKFSAKASVSMLTGKLLLEGPFPTGSFIFTSRKSIDTKILKPFQNDKNVPINFHDISLKILFKDNDFLKDGKFQIFGYLSGDKLKNKNLSSPDYEWENKLLGFKWLQLSDTPLFYEVSLSYSGFNAKNFPKLSDQKLFENSIDDITFKMDFHHVSVTKDELHLGLKIKEITSKYITENNRTFLSNEQNGKLNLSGPKGTNISFYIKYKFLRNDILGLDIGSRYNLTKFSLNKSGDNFFEPRINFTLNVSPNISLKFSSGIYNQEIITLSNENELINIFEPWFIIPSYLKPGKAIHYVSGINYKLSNKTILEIEAYYKNLVRFASLNENRISNQDQPIINSSGIAKGVEFNLGYNSFPQKLNIAYSYSITKINHQKISYFPRYDSRHSLNFSLENNFGDGWYSTITWTYNSGVPYTQITGFHDKLYISTPPNSNDILTNYHTSTLYGKRNVKRVPDYHRLDINISKNIDFDFMRIYLSLSVINIYNRKNFFYFDRNTGDRINMLPILPTLTIKVEI